MNFKKFRPVFELAAYSVLAFVLHLLFFHFFASGKDTGFLYSIPQLYGVFFVMAFVIILILIRMKAKNIDSVGNTFMLLTCVKMVVAYVLLHPILDATHLYAATEKTNFFFVFAIFLTIETVVSIRLLNQNDAQ